MKNKICCWFLSSCLLLALIMPIAPAKAGDMPYVGEMLWVPYNFEPMDWAFCDGRLLPISQYDVLFSLLGTQYGGDGITTFALPDMRGRLMVKDGQGAGLSPYVVGQMGGESTHTLNVNEMPTHSHGLMAATETGSDSSPAGKLYGGSSSGKQYGPNPAAPMAPTAIVPVGGGQPHNNMMPYTGLNCIISLYGIYPSPN